MPLKEGALLFIKEMQVLGCVFVLCCQQAVQSNSPPSSPLCSIFQILQKFDLIQNVKISYLF
jgi:hypothetical protein